VNWAWLVKVSGNLNQVGMLKVSGANMFFAGGPTTSGRVYYSADTGANWDNVAIDISAWIPRIGLNPLDGTLVYVNANNTEEDSELEYVTNIGANPVLQSGDKIGPKRWGDSYWFSALSASVQRLVKESSALAGTMKLFVTNDAWMLNLSSYTVTPNTIRTLAQWTSSYTDDYIIFGCDSLAAANPATTSSVIMCAVIDDPTDVVARAGANCGAAPYTNAIPWNCGGVTVDGIQPVA